MFSKLISGLPKGYVEDVGNSLAKYQQEIDAATEKCKQELRDKTARYNVRMSLLRVSDLGT